MRALLHVTPKMRAVLMLGAAFLYLLCRGLGWEMWVNKARSPKEARVRREKMDIEFYGAGCEGFASSAQEVFTKAKREFADGVMFDDVVHEVTTKVQELASARETGQAGFDELRRSFESKADAWLERVRRINMHKTAKMTKMQCLASSEVGLVVMMGLDILLQRLAAHFVPQVDLPVPVPILTIAKFAAGWFNDFYEESVFTFLRKIQDVRGVPEITAELKTHFKLVQDQFQFLANGM